MLTLASLSPAIAYELDYQLDDYFLVETIHSRSRVTETQVWHLNFRHGLVNGKEAFVDFRLVVLSLAPSKSETPSIKDIQVLENDPSSSNTIFAANTLIAEFGIARKLFVKVEFNDDGSLKDLTGSTVNTLEPGTTTSYRLVRDSKPIQLVLANKFASKDYSYHRRYKQHPR